MNASANLVNSWKFKSVELVCSGSPWWRFWTGGHFNSHLRPSVCLVLGVVLKQTHSPYHCGNFYSGNCPQCFCRSAVFTQRPAIVYPGRKLCTLISSLCLCFTLCPFNYHPTQCFLVWLTAVSEFKH